MDTILALTAFAALLAAWIAIGKRRDRTPKLTIMHSDAVENSAA